MSTQFDQLVDFVQSQMAVGTDRIAFENKGKEKANLKLNHFKVTDFVNRENPETPQTVNVFYYNDKKGSGSQLWHGSFTQTEDGTWNLQSGNGSAGHIPVEHLSELAEIGKLVSRFYSETKGQTKPAPSEPVENKKS